MIVQKIEQRIHKGTIIPKPAAKAEFVVKGWGTRRREKALIYRIPNHRDSHKPYEKGITVSELEQAYEQIAKTGKLRGDWFKRNMKRCAQEGYCNFTTIGGIFELLGVAVYRDHTYWLER